MKRLQSAKVVTFLHSEMYTLKDKSREGFQEKIDS